MIITHLIGNIIYVNDKNSINYVYKKIFIQLYDLGSFGRGCYSKGKPEFLTIENENLIVINYLIQLSHEDSIYLLLLKIIEIHNEDKILNLLDCWNLFCLLYENESIIFPIRFIVYYNLRENKLYLLKYIKLIEFQNVDYQLVVIF